MSCQPRKMVPVHEAEGLTLIHDITCIVPGGFKGPVFKRGHVIAAGDIAELLRLGKEHIYVCEPNPGLVHEDEAALRIARAVAGPGLEIGTPREGRVNLTATRHGLLKVRVEGLHALNTEADIALATLHTNQDVPAGRDVAGTRVIPLMVREETLERVQSICAQGPILEVRPYMSLKVGLITTGSEIFHGRITDAFGPVIRKKFDLLGCSVMGQRFTSDDVPRTVEAIRSFQAEGVGMIVITGGMSVDPDDRTPEAIRVSGARVVRYGAPVFPGAMFMLAWLGGTPVLGLPGCVMYHKASIFDLLVPRLLASETIEAEDIIALGHGGFCAACQECRYPLCHFGKH